MGAMEPGGTGAQRPGSEIDSVLSRHDSREGPVVLWAAFQPLEVTSRVLRYITPMTVDSRWPASACIDSGIHQRYGHGRPEGLDASQRVSLIVKHVRRASWTSKVAPLSWALMS